MAYLACLACVCIGLYKPYIDVPRAPLYDTIIVYASLYSHERSRSL